MNIGKKVITFFIVFSIVISFSVKVFSKEQEEITAPSAILMESNTGKVMYEKNSHEKLMCASITKVMTILLTMEEIDKNNISIDELVTTSKHAASMGGSNVFLTEGEQMSVDDLLKSVVVVSANDAAVVLAEKVAGSEQSFVEKMNMRAKELGMNDTTFKNCNGLDEDGHLTSAYDVALMSKELIKHTQIYSYTSIWIDYLRDGSTQLVNTNKLLKTYKGITGLKTGTTEKAGCCISATAERNDLKLISVVLGCKNTKDRFKDATILLDYGFSNYVILSPQLPSDFPETICVKNGMKLNVHIKKDTSNNIPIIKGKEKELKSKVEILEEIEAPIEKGKIIGKIIYKLGDEIISESNIIVDEKVEEINFLSVLKIFLMELIAK